MAQLYIGTCSWKYDSWKGIVYPDFGEFNYLEEYSKKYNSVEIDQWFWSLHPKNKVILPNSNLVDEYNNSTPDEFKFTIKVPNSVTLTHPYKSTELNRHFLSIDLMESFLDSIKILKPKIGMLMFQFEYLNKQKMISQIEFQKRLAEFFSQINSDYKYAIEIRNPNYLNKEFFTFLHSHNLSYVFLHGYYMPSIFETYNKFESYLINDCVVRLHGADREGIEKKTDGIWNNIVDPRDSDLKQLIKMINNFSEKGVDLYLNVNNHFEGSAPLTIKKIKNLLNSNN